MDMLDVGTEGRSPRERGDVGTGPKSWGHCWKVTSTFLI